MQPSPTRCAPYIVSFSAPRFEEGGEEATQVNLNFTSPGASIYTDTAVDLVIIPGVSGDYGVTAGHTPTISELRPGTVEIFHKADDEPEKYFISGGFAFTHENSTTDISAAELCPLEDLDLGEAERTLRLSKRPSLQPRKIHQSVLKHNWLQRQRSYYYGVEGINYLFVSYGENVYLVRLPERKVRVVGRQVIRGTFVCVYSWYIVFSTQTTVRFTSLSPFLLLYVYLYMIL